MKRRADGDWSPVAEKVSWQWKCPGEGDKTTDPSTSIHLYDER